MFPRLIIFTLFFLFSNANLPPVFSRLLIRGGTCSTSKGKKNNNVEISSNSTKKPAEKTLSAPTKHPGTVELIGPIVKEGTPIDLFSERAAGNGAYGDVFKLNNSKVQNGSGFVVKVEHPSVEPERRRLSRANQLYPTRKSEIPKPLIYDVNGEKSELSVLKVLWKSMSEELTEEDILNDVFDFENPNSDKPMKRKFKRTPGAKSVVRGFDKPVKVSIKDPEATGQTVDTMGIVFEDLDFSLAELAQRSVKGTMNTPTSHLGVSWEDAIRALKNNYPPIQVIGGLRQIKEALDFIHKNGVTHNDLLPQNVMVRKNAGGFVLIDFGKAKIFDDENELSSAVNGNADNTPYTDRGRWNEIISTAQKIFVDENTGSIFSEQLGTFSEQDLDGLFSDGLAVDAQDFKLETREEDVTSRPVLRSLSQHNLLRTASERKLETQPSSLKDRLNAAANSPASSCNSSRNSSPGSSPGTPGRSLIERRGRSPPGITTEAHKEKAARENSGSPVQLSAGTVTTITTGSKIMC